jgi:hypothetical protein
MYPTPVSTQDIPLFSNTTPLEVHHSLKALNSSDV